MDAVRFGRGVRALPRRRRLRQEDLGRAAGCSPSLVSRVERGRGDLVTPRQLDRIAGALGARVVLRLDWNGEALDRLLDEDHAAIVESVVRVLKASGWQVVTEATFALGGERGAVDVLGWRESSGSLLVVEVKSIVADAQETLSRLDRKVRLATRIAPGAWRAGTARRAGTAWRAGPVQQELAVSSLLVIGDNRTNRRRVAALGATFEAAFPDRIAAVRRFVRDPAALPIRGLWFLPIRTQATARHRVRRS